MLNFHILRSGLGSISPYVDPIIGLRGLGAVSDPNGAFAPPSLTDNFAASSDPAVFAGQGASAYDYARNLQSAYTSANQANQDKYRKWLADGSASAPPQYVGVDQAAFNSWWASFPNGPGKGEAPPQSFWTGAVPSTFGVTNTDVTRIPGYGQPLYYAPGSDPGPFAQGFQPASTADWTAAYAPYVAQQAAAIARQNAGLPPLTTAITTTTTPVMSPAQLQTQLHVQATNPQPGVVHAGNPAAGNPVAGPGNAASGMPGSLPVAAAAPGFMSSTIFGIPAWLVLGGAALFLFMGKGK